MSDRWRHVASVTVQTELVLPPGTLYVFGTVGCHNIDPIRTVKVNIYAYTTGTHFLGHFL